MNARWPEVLELVAPIGGITYFRVVRQAHQSKTEPKTKPTMKRLLVVATLITATFLLTGSSCISSLFPSSLAQLTASHVSGVKANQVSVSNVSQNGKTVSWMAATPKGVYNCSLNGITKQVIVAKK